MGVLYLVATPIGNLEDISARALKILAQVNLIAAEDTRHTHKLLDHFQISTPMLSYHEHNKLSRLDEVLAALAHGNVALVSDAGTPALNDPGYELVRAALDAGFPVSPIPGPSAPLAALVVSGLPTDSFLYLGYLPRKLKERRSLLEQVAAVRYTLIFLESPHRVAASLRDLHSVLGDRQIALARELTKLYEEVFRGSLSEAIARFDAQPARGEITLVIAGNHSRQAWDEEQLQVALQQAITEGRPTSQAAGEIAAQSGWPRRKIYRLLTSETGIGAMQEKE